MFSCIHTHVRKAVAMSFKLTASIPLVKDKNATHPGIMSVKEVTSQRIARLPSTFDKNSARSWLG